MLKCKPLAAPPFRITNMITEDTTFTLYPNIGTYEVVEYLLPVDRKDIDAANQVLVDNPSFMLKKCPNEQYHRTVNDVSERIVPFDSGSLYFIVRSRTREEVMKMYENKCLYYPPNEIDRVLKDLDRLNLPYYLHNVLVIAEFDISVNNWDGLECSVRDGRIYPPNNLAFIDEDGQTCESGDYFWAGDWVKKCELRRPTLNWDAKPEILTFDVDSMDGTIKYYIPGIVITNDTSQVDPLDKHVNSDGDTQLMEAIRKKDYKLANESLTKQSFDIMNFNGETALDLIEKRVIEAKELLEFYTQWVSKMLHKK